MIDFIWRCVVWSIVTSFIITCLTLIWFEFSFKCWHIHAHANSDVVYHIIQLLPTHIQITCILSKIDVPITETDLLPLKRIPKTERNTRICDLKIYLYHLLEIRPPIPLWFVPERHCRTQLVLMQVPLMMTMMYLLSSYFHALYDHGKRLESFSRLRLLQTDTIYTNTHTQ